ncbi:MAG: lytic transglycosylase domain-containing protein [Candidatus Bipolaricaulota bacterium]|nr:lytic transglycosylase domain-containing protein [Candidatus Bipolaricaulota bacterium]
MKWIALPIVLVGAALALAALLLPGGDTASSALAGYESLRKAQAGLPQTIAGLEDLAARDGAVGWEARVLAARAHAAAGRFAEAATFLRRALELRVTTALRAELGTMLEAAGLRAEAKAEWEKLLPKTEAVLAMMRLEPDAVRLATLLVGAGRYADALPLVTPPATDAARLARARCLAGLGTTGEAASEFARYLEKHSGETAVRIEYGRVVERAGDSAGALQIYRGVGAAGAYREGLLLESLGRIQDAVGAYQRSSDSEARWRAARLLESMGDAEGALKIYEALASGTHRVRDDAALRATLLLRDAGHADQAAGLADKLPAAFEWILGSYVPAKRSGSTSGTVSSSVAGALRVADALAKRGDAEWAASELDFALTSADTAGRIAVGEWFAAHNDPRRAFQIGSELLPKDAARAVAKLAYPRAWWANVERWSSTYGVDPYLVLAVIREESNYLPTAVSSSNAGGLMQLLPSTAKWIAESKCKLRYTSELSFDPDANIRMGTWYLSYLTGLYDKDVVRAVAAYNSGNGNVDRWTAAANVTRRADVPGALGSIETREYLVKVLNSWLIYRELYASDPTS